MKPRLTKAQLTAGGLCLLLGFGAATQVRSTQEADFSALRQSELIEVLDQLTARSEQLQGENRDLERQKEELTNSRTQENAAVEAARERAEVQGILAGTLPAKGPGVTVTVTDPEGEVTGADLYRLVDELRNAGAEAIQVGDVRITASTWFKTTTDGPGVTVDDQRLTPPYRWIAIGDSQTLQGALGIPGGALAQMRNRGGSSTVKAVSAVTITAIKSLRPDAYAQAIE
jgi:uncharacterized protein YlxW (UPF0749 family)